MFIAPRHRAVFAIDGKRGHGTSHTSISRVSRITSREPSEAECEGATASGPMDRDEIDRAARTEIETCACPPII